MAPHEAEKVTAAAVCGGRCMIHGFHTGAAAGGRAGASVQATKAKVRQARAGV